MGAVAGVGVIGVAAADQESSVSSPAQPLLIRVAVVCCRSMFNDRSMFNIGLFLLETAVGKTLRSFSHGGVFALSFVGPPTNDESLRG
jgi:hypothetical protein